jgi:hypothetical protein
MRTVYKYPFSDRTESTVQMPEGAIVTHVASQDGRATIWAEVDTDAPPQSRSFSLVPTGGEVPAGAHHVGTFLSGPTVWHVSEVAPPEWQEWSGGDDAPAGTYGKVVDISYSRDPVTHTAPDWTGPAAVANWSEPCRYRFAAEQPDLPL